MIGETTCGDFVELVNGFLRHFALAFLALLSVTLHVIASRKDVFITVVIHVDIQTGGEFFYEHVFFHHNCVDDLRFTLRASEVNLVKKCCQSFQVDFFPHYRPTCFCKNSLLTRHLKQPICAVKI